MAYIASAGYLDFGKMPTGIFADRNPSPVQGEIYFATDLGVNGIYICYSGAIWKPLGGIGVLACTGAVTGTHTGDTAETVLKTLTIPAGLISANGQMRLSVGWVAVGTAGTKNRKIYLSSSAGGKTTSFFSLTGANTIISDFTIKGMANRNSLSSQVFAGTSALGTYGNAATAAEAIAGINTANAFYFDICGTLSNAADSIALDSYLLEWLEP